MLLSKELNKNIQIKDYLKKTCADKKRDPQIIFCSVNFEFSATEYILKNLIELGVSPEQFSKLMEIVILLKNIFFLQDDFMRATKDNYANMEMANLYMTSIENQIINYEKFIADQNIQFLFTGNKKHWNASQ